MARGSVAPRKNAAGEITSWRIVYDVPAPDGTRKQKTESARTRRAAEKLLRDRLTEIDGGTYVAPSKETVGEFLLRWHAIRAPGWTRVSTRGHMLQTIERRINPWLGPIPLQKLKAIDVERWVSALAETHARTTVGHALTLVRRALRDGVRWGEVARNAAEGVKPAGAAPKVKRALSAADAGKLIAAATGEQERALWWVLLDAGLRVGEALSLRWDDVDLARREIRVRRTLSRSGSQYVEIEGGKTKSSARTAAIGPETAAALKAHRAAQNAERLRLGGAWRDEGRVFPGMLGAMLRPTRVRARLLACCKRAKIAPVAIHELRHSMTTIAVESGAALKAVQATLGHSNATMTLGVYTHARDNQRVEAAELIEAAILASRDDAEAATG